MTKPETELDRLIRDAKIKLDRMTPEEREAMWTAQRESWVRGEMGMNETSVMLAASPPAPSVGDVVPVDMLLWCPACGEQHIDDPDERTPGWVNPPHRSHLCHSCTHIWRPADVATNGVRALKTQGKSDSVPIPPILHTKLLEFHAAKEAAESKLTAQASEVERLTNFGAPDIGVACEATDKAGLPGVSRMLRAVLGKWQAAKARATTAESSLETARGALEPMQAVVDAAQCIQHWHDTNYNPATGETEGMVVSAEHVKKLWSALAALPSPPITKIKGEG